jgi:hypothetical protein
VSVGAVVGSRMLSAAYSPERPTARTRPATPGGPMQPECRSVTEASKFSAELADHDRRLASSICCVQTVNRKSDRGLHWQRTYHTTIRVARCRSDQSVVPDGGRTVTCAGASHPWTNDVEHGCKCPALGTPTPNCRCRAPRPGGGHR